MEKRQQQLSQVMQRVDGVAPGNGLPKHVKMSISPFVMLRGASSVFYDDLASGTLQIPKALTELPLTTLIGDCHISNFGLFSEEGSHGERIVFAPNDFDDACIGHAIWDLLRYSTSLMLCADHCLGVKDGDYPTDDPITKKVVSSATVSLAVKQFFQTYHQSCQALLEGQLSYRYVMESFEEKHILHKRYAKATARVCGGDDFLLKSSLAKAVDLESTPLAFRDIPERFERLDPLEYKAIEEHFSPYVDDNIIDIVVRLGAGTGSVNMQRYYLLVGPSASADKTNWPLFHIVEIKKQREAAPLFEFSDLSPVNRLNPAHLTVVCQRRMQRNPDLVLDEVEWRGAHWLVRSRHHSKVGVDPEHIACGKKAINGGFIEYAQACAKTLAIAHARGDRRSNRFERQVVEILPTYFDLLYNTTQAYADQVKTDWQWLKAQES